jgi:hypothetical protein
MIRRPVEDVFDYVADERHEPNFNTRMSHVELLTRFDSTCGRRRRRSGERTLADRRVRSLGGVRERRRGLAADNRGGLVNQFVVV